MNTQGINFDIGLPLTQPEEFDILFVDCEREKSIRLHKWFENADSTPIAISGQIGCGKTTFIEKVLLESNVKPDIHIRLEVLIGNTRGHFYGEFIHKLFSCALKNGIGLEKYGFEKFFDNEIKTLIDFIEILKPSVNIKVLEKQSAIFEYFNNHSQIIKEPLLDICLRIEKSIDRKLFIIAEGIDKFNPGSFAFEELIDFLNFISNFKTLYEVNLVHIFRSEKWRMESEQLIITSVSDKVIREMLVKRLGIYADNFVKELPKLYKLSGGNFRQALRLLTNYEFALRKLKKSKRKSIEYAAQKTRQDLLTSETADFKLLKVIGREQVLFDGTIKSDAGIHTVLSNQVFLISEKNVEDKWPAIVNPLILNAVNSFKDYDAYKPEIDEDGNYYEPLKFNIENFFHSLAPYFLSQNKNEIVVAIYDDLEIAKIVNDYIVGRAGAYEEIYYQDIEINNSNYNQLFENPEKPFTGISCFFTDKLDAAAIKILDIKRDMIIENNMLWWIDQQHIYDYIKDWTHLRQFISFYNLQRDILKDLLPEEIQHDIDDLKFLNYKVEESRAIEQRLKKVLNYLNQKTNG